MSISAESKTKEEGKGPASHEAGEPHQVKHLRLVRPQEPFTMKPLPDDKSGDMKHQPDGLRGEIYGVGLAMSVYFRRIMDIE